MLLGDGGSVGPADIRCPRLGATLAYSVADAGGIGFRSATCGLAQSRYPESPNDDLVYKRLAEEWGIAVSRAECVTYGKFVKNWPAFPDPAGALQYLKRHYNIADNRAMVGDDGRNRTFLAGLLRLGHGLQHLGDAERLGLRSPAPAAMISPALPASFFLQPDGLLHRDLVERKTVV